MLSRLHSINKKGTCNQLGVLCLVAAVFMQLKLVCVKSVLCSILAHLYITYQSIPVGGIKAGTRKCGPA